MKPVILVAGLAVAVSGCNRGAVPANNVVAPNSAATANSSNAGANAAAPTGNPDDPAGAVAFVGGIYQQYLDGKEPDFSKVYTAELNAALNRFDGEHEGLGYDPFCMCQDFVNFGYSIQKDDPTPQGRRVEVEISNDGERQTRVILLARENGQWRVANIGEGEEAIYKPRAARQR